jgi:hypothetical protein
MIPRRHFIGRSSTLAGALGFLPAEEAEGQTPTAQRVEPELRPIVDALDRLALELRLQRGFAEIGPVRDAQRLFLRQNGKLPDYIEVGADTWFAIHDWHVKWQQDLNLGLDASGRYTLLLLRTIVILRQDLPDRYVGQPYDTVR